MSNFITNVKGLVSEKAALAMELAEKNGKPTVVVVGYSIEPRDVDKIKKVLDALVGGEVNQDVLVHVARKPPEGEITTGGYER